MFRKLFGNDVPLLKTVTLKKNGENGGYIRQACFSPDSKVLAIGSFKLGGGRYTTFWDVTRGKPLMTLEGVSASYIQFHPNGMMVALRGFNNIVQLWDVKTGALLKTLIAHTRHINCLKFSPDGVILVSGARDDGIDLWNIKSGELLKKLSTEGGVTSIDISADGLILLSGLWSGVIKLWDIKTGELLKALNGHRSNSVEFRNAVELVQFNPDAMGYKRRHFTRNPKNRYNTRWACTQRDNVVQP